MVKKQDYNRDGLTITGAEQLSTMLDQSKNGSVFSALTLITIKAHLLEKQEYEMLRDLHVLELLHDWAIDF